MVQYYEHCVQVPEKSKYPESQGHWLDVKVRSDPVHDKQYVAVPEQF